MGGNKRSHNLKAEQPNKPRSELVATGNLSIVISIPRATTCLDVEDEVAVVVVEAAVAAEVRLLCSFARTITVSWDFSDIPHFAGPNGEVTVQTVGDDESC